MNIGIVFTLIETQIVIDADAVGILIMFPLVGYAGDYESRYGLDCFKYKVGDRHLQPIKKTFVKGKPFLTNPQLNRIGYLILLTPNMVKLRDLKSKFLLNFKLVRRELRLEYGA